MNIAICGGGNLGHALVSQLSLNSNVNVSLLTSRPELWSSRISMIRNSGEKTVSGSYNVSKYPKDTIKEADIVIITTPSFLIENLLVDIKPFLKATAWVGSVQCSGGFFWIANKVLCGKNKLFGFQRVPYISRVNEYGKSVFLKGIKPVVYVSIYKEYDDVREINKLSDLLEIKFEFLSSYLNATLTNSNPILHPARLYDIFKSWSKGDYFKEEPLFYEHWTNRASEVLFKCDRELSHVVDKLSTKMTSLVPIFEHYEVVSVEGLTNKLKNIEAFKGIKLKMKKDENGFLPDFNDRYFVEDISIGLVLLKGVAEVVEVNTPMIDEIIYWAQNLLGKEYVVAGKLSGADVKETVIPANYGIHCIDQF